MRRQLTSTMQGTLADISTLVEESLSVSGVLLAKTMGQTDELTARFEEESHRLADLEQRSRMAGRWVMGSIQATFAVMPALMYGVAGYLLATGGPSISIGTLVAFTTLQTRLFFPVSSLLSVQTDVQSSLALFDRVFEYLDLPVDIDERPDAVTLDRARVQGRVEFDDVSFGYDPDAAPILEGISFVAEPGSKVAVVGETGSGKTTLGYLVARLYDVGSGAVRIDGTDVRDLTFDSLRSIVGVVSQETYLFHGTVRENLAFARPGASDEEIEAAAKAAQIHEHLHSLPEGYDTVVGERGYRFSGGEKQRLAIARAVLRDPPVLAAGRGDQLARRRDRAGRAGGARRAQPGPHQHRHRPPPVDRARRRPDPRARPRPHRRARHALRARRHGRPLRRAGRARRRDRVGACAETHRYGAGPSQVADLHTPAAERRAGPWRWCSTAASGASGMTAR